KPVEEKVKNINPYLVEGSDVVVLKRRLPICNVHPISFGSMPNDGGNLLLSDTERAEYERIEKDGGKFIKPLISSHEYLNGKKRWCFWLVDASPSEIRKLTVLSERIEKVKAVRLTSNRISTKKLANYP